MANLPKRLTRRALFWIALAVTVCTGAVAQDVRLVARESGITFDGDLLGFDGDHYRIDTVYGPLTVNAAGVICKGAVCPQLGAYLPSIRFSGDDYMARDLLPKLIEGFAQQSGMKVRRRQTSDDKFLFEFTGEAKIGRFEIHATSNAESYADLITEGADIALVTRLPRIAEINMSTSSGLGDLVSGRRAHVLALNSSDNTGSLPDTCRDAPLPGSFAMQSGDYPQTGRMMLYTAPRRLPEIGRDFLRYLTTTDANQRITDLGHAPPALLEREVDHFGRRLARAISAVDGMTSLGDLKRFTDAMVNRTRLSATFRFRGDGTALDMVSRDLLKRLADSEYAGRELILAGFSAAGSQSFKTSQRYIQALQKELRKHGITETRSLPFGSIMPVLCDTGSLGDQFNNRVEIWLD